MEYVDLSRVDREGCDMDKDRRTLEVLHKTEEYLKLVELGELVRKGEDISIPRSCQALKIHQFSCQEDVRSIITKEYTFSSALNLWEIWKEKI